MDGASLTVSILTRNRNKYLVEALEAIRTQSYANFVVKILDNASTDETDRVVKPFLSDNRFEYVRHPVNIGGSGNYAYALAHCSTDFLLITHDDDRMKPNMVLEEMAVLYDHPDVNLVCCENDYIDDSGKTLCLSVFSRAFNFGKLFFHGRYDFIKSYIAGLNYISCPTAVLRMAPIRNRGLSFRQDVGPALDTVFWMDLNCLPGRFAFIGESLYEYRKHGFQDSALNTLATFAGLKEAVWDILERENLCYLVKNWRSRIDKDVLSLLVNRLKSSAGIEQSLIHAIKLKLMSRGKPSFRTRWILFLAINSPSIFLLASSFGRVSTFLRGAMVHALRTFITSCSKSPSVRP